MSMVPALQHQLSNDLLLMNNGWKMNELKFTTHCYSDETNLRPRLCFEEAKIES